jgi:hypothetical protein
LFGPPEGNGELTKALQLPDRPPPRLPDHGKEVACGLADPVFATA